MERDTKLLVLTILLIIVATVSEIQARDLYVGGVGKDHFPTIRTAIDAAEPGDTIHLNPTDSPYREMALFRDVSGTPEHPIVLDGHGAMLLGCDPVDSAQWEDQGEGLWRSTVLAQKLKVNMDMIARFYFVFDDQPQYMGGAFKHERPTLKAPADLKINEWTYIESENAFYIRIPADVALDEANVEVPVRSAGVAMQGNSSHLIVRNIKASRTWNDGFNIHGQCTNILFENIEAIECGDDGISAHGQCEITVNGMISRGNANGVCHVNESRTVSRNIHIKDSRAYDLYLLHASKHEFYDLTIDPAGPRGTVFTSGTEAMIQDSTMGTDQTKSKLVIQNGARVAFVDSQLRNTNINVRDATAELIRATITGQHATLTVTEPRGWQMQNCTWEGTRLTHNGRKFEVNDLAGFQKSIEVRVKENAH